MKYKILIFPLFYLSYINGYDLSEYEAKYKFESNEISITGIREFKKIRMVTKYASMLQIL